MRCDPVGEADVQVRAAALRHAGVGDVADQGVLEAHSRSSARLDSSAPRTKSRCSSASRLRVDLGAAAVQLRHGARPEDHADDRRVVGDAACPGAGRLSRREPIIACRLVGTASVVEVALAVEDARVVEHAHRLLEEERVAAGVRGAAPRRGCPAAARGRRAARRGAPRSPPRRAPTSAIVVRRVARRCRSRGAARAARAAPSRGRGSAPSASAMNSIRSKSVGSAQCRSSKTSTSGRVAASSSSTRRMPQWSSACEISAADGAARPSSDADQVRERGGDRPELVGILVAEAVEQRRRASPRRRLGVVALEDPGRAFEDLLDRPVRDALAVGEAAAPEHVGRRRRRGARARRAAGSCRCPGSPTIVASAGRPLAADAVPEREQPVELGLAADSGASRPRPRTGASFTPTACQTGTGSALPLASIGSCSRYSIACAVAR